MNHSDVLLKSVPVHPSSFNQQITGKDMVWLNSRGGRDSTDVEIDEMGRKYVLMWSAEEQYHIDSKGNCRVYLPTTYLEYVQHSLSLRMQKEGALFPLVNC